MRSTKYQFRCSVASRTYIRKIGLVRENFCRAKITKNKAFSFNQKIVRLNISMANAKRMDIHESPKNLIGENLDIGDADSFFIGLDKVIQVTIVIIHDDV